MKVAQVGNEGEFLLQAITRCTNSQNAVRERDFLALTNDFRSWQSELAKIPQHLFGNPTRGLGLSTRHTEAEDVWSTVHEVGKRC
ncbi:MAG: AIPR family protein [Acetobacteraceae bacterium]|nr:AIPR family protein [Acetobacteraceae bacterium]